MAAYSSGVIVRTRQEVHTLVHWALAHSVSDMGGVK